MTDDERANSKTPAKDLIIGEFTLLELTDGSYVCEMINGERRPAPASFNRLSVGDGLRYGTFVEVGA